MSPAASSLLERPSTIKLFEKLRWLPMEIPWPGTAAVSAKSWFWRRVGGRDSGNQQRGVQKVAAVQRKLLNLGLRDRAGDLRSRGFEDRSVTRDGNACLGRRNTERDRQIKGRADRQGKIPNLIVESLLVNSYLIGPDLEVGKAEAPIAIGGDN